MADHIEDTDLKKRHAKKGPRTSAARSLINEWHETQSFLMFQDRLRSTVTVLEMKGSLEMKSSHKLLLRVVYAEILNCFILLSPNIDLLAFHKLHAVFF